MVRNHGHGHINHLIIISYHIVSCHITVIVISLKTLACIERCVYEKKKLKENRKDTEKGGEEGVCRVCVCVIVGVHAQRGFSPSTPRSDKGQREIEREA